MIRGICVKGLGLLLLAIAMAAPSVLAQDQGRGLSCRNDSYDDRLENYCEIREQTVHAGSPVRVDGLRNGSVSIKGWDRDQMLVRTMVVAAAPSQSEAKQLADQVRIETGGSQISANGPEAGRDHHWYVSYEVFVPHRSDVSLRTHNGSIGVMDVAGEIDFQALNGSVTLNRLSGKVHGSTSNGSVRVTLSGDRWNGEGVDISTRNGSVNIIVPDNYSAHLETGTVNGSLNVGFPITIQGSIKRNLETDLGSGGATIRVTTNNGGVSIRRAD